MSNKNEPSDPLRGGRQPSSKPHSGQPKSKQPPASDQGSKFKFEMPHDMPSSFQDVVPVGGLTRIFRTDGLPQLLKLSYIMWLVSAAMWLFFTFFSFLGSLFMLTTNAYRSNGVLGIIMSFVSIVLIVGIVLCAMKLKEGKQWARLALSVIVVAGFITMFVGGTGGGLLGLVAAVLMWLPESSAWFRSVSRR